MLQEKSAREYQTIAASVSRDVALLASRDHLDARNFSAALGELMNSYALHYRRYNIELVLVNTRLFGAAPPDTSENPILSFRDKDGAHVISISGALPAPFQFYRLTYQLDISEEIANTEQIRRILLLSTVGFSIIAAVVLYFILRSVFRPLEIVADASRNMADGQYQERIHLKGKHELANVASAFNQMADQVEGHIQFLEEEAERKQQFVDNFAHEIRTPLTSIYGYAEYLQKTPIKEDELVESTGHIMAEAAHMGTISNSLLDMATLRDYVPNIEEISIPGLFDDIRQSLLGALREKGVQLHCAYNAEHLEGQADLIKMLLLNLCKNALTACVANQGEIWLDADRQDGQITLSVTDNGHGIPAESLPKVTEPFYRADKARNRAEGGVGLGLTLCQQIADVHGAELIIQSEMGHGTKVNTVFTTP